MSWIVAGTAIGSAVLGAAQGAQKRKAEQASNQANAELTAAQTEFSPWTHLQPQSFTSAPVASSGFGGAAQGALGGAMFGQGLKKQNMESAQLEEEKAKIAGMGLSARGGRMGY